MSRCKACGGLWPHEIQIMSGKATYIPLCYCVRRYRVRRKEVTKMKKSKPMPKPGKPTKGKGKPC